MCHPVSSSARLSFVSKTISTCNSGARREGGCGAVEVGGGAKREGGGEEASQEGEEGAQDHLQRRPILLAGRGREGASNE